MLFKPSNMVEQFLKRYAAGERNFRGINLSRADLTLEGLNHANLKEADLSGAILNGVDLIGADLTKANLSGAKLLGADLSGAVLAEANLSDALLSGAILVGTRLTKANLRSAVLTGASLEGANLKEACLKRANLSWANLSHTDLLDAEVLESELTKANLNNTTMPDGTISVLLSEPAEAVVVQNQVNQKPVLGHYLIEAGLLTPNQVNVALVDQEESGMHFSQILVARNWLKEQTVDFFVKRVIRAKDYPAASTAKPLGGYLVEAGLISPAQVNVALADQEESEMRFGQILVARNWIKEQTIDFIIDKVIRPEQKGFQLI